MEASKGNTTNIPAGSPLKQEQVRIPALLSRSPLLAFSAILSKPLIFSDLYFFFFSCFSRSLCFLQNPSNFSSQLCFFSFSLGAKPLKTSKLFPHAFRFCSTESPLVSLQKTPFVFLTSPLFQKPLKLLILSIHTTPFSSHSALEKSPSALEPPNTFISPISQGGQLPSHYFITLCPPRLHMDSRWVAINPKNGPNRT